MAATFTRSNASSPTPQGHITSAQVPMQSLALEYQGYSKTQLLDFIKEARHQAKNGASPNKIAMNHKFLDDESNPRFSTSAIAEWIAIPANGIERWLDSTTLAQVTLRPNFFAAGSVGIARTPSSRSPSPMAEEAVLYQLEHFDSRRARAWTPDQAHAASSPHRQGSLPAATAMTAASAAVAKATALAAAAKAAAAEAAAATEMAAAAAAQEAMTAERSVQIAANATSESAAWATPAPAPAVHAGRGFPPSPRCNFRSPRAHNTPSRPGTPTTEEESLRQEVASLREALAAAQASQTAAPASSSQLITDLVSALLQQQATSQAPPYTPRPITKPFKDFMPKFPPYSGTDAPEAFLAQFRTLAHQFQIPQDQLNHQLIAKLSGDALTWFNLHFAGQDTTATLDEIALALRNEFGREYAGAQAFRDTWRIQVDLSQGGAQRLRALDLLEERARQQRVPRAPGPHECRFYHLLDILSPSESNRLFSELTANSQCSEKTLRQLEESGDLPGHTAGFGPPRHSLLAPPTPAREALFALRVELTEAFLHRILPSTRGPSRDRPARVFQTSGLPAESTPTSASAEPVKTPHTMAASPSPTPAVTEAQAECMVLTDRLAAVDGQGFRGPPEYFGTNADPDKKKQNHAEFTRRRQHGLCFKCTPADVTAGSFRSCPRHGIAAVQSGAALQAASVNRDRSRNSSGESSP